MISGKIYFREGGKGAYINLSGDEVKELRKKLKPGDRFSVIVEEEGTQILLTKAEKSIK